MNSPTDAFVRAADVTVTTSAPKAVPQAETCFHCGLPVPVNTNWQASIDGAMRSMCCPGCKAVAEGIIASGFADYYRTRFGFAVTADQKELLPPELALYDAENDGSSAESVSLTRDAVFSIQDIRCAACVWLIERRVAHVDGVLGVDMNVATAQLSVSWDRARCKPSDIIKALRAIGYAAFPFDSTRHGEQLERARKKLFRRLFIAGLSMMQVMMYAVPVYIAKDGTMNADMTELMRWAGLLLTLPAVFFSAQPFYLGSWFNLKNRMLGMDVPVTLGIAAAFIGSVAATVRGHGEVYFDSITMFIFLLLCSRYLELGARRKAASALDNLQHALPASALRLLSYPRTRDTELVAVAQLRCDDMILVRPGDAIAADGVIVDGASTIDQSLLTGESRAQTVGKGSSVPGGAINLSHPFVQRVTRPMGDSTLSVLMQLVEKATHAKPRIAQWADRVAAWFVVSLLLFAAGVFVYWHTADPARAWPIAIAVLVVSCPCALSLATPTVLAAATNSLLRQGVLIVRPHVLETLHRATHVIFDKTGTLTVGKPVLQHIEVQNKMPEDDCLRIAQCLAASSVHPLSAALVAAAPSAPGRDCEGHDIQHIAGQGLEGTVNGTRYRLGSAAFVCGWSDQASGGAGNGMATTSVYFGNREGRLARFDFQDALRDDALDVIEHFRRRGKTLVLLSGDQQEVTSCIAAELGINEALGRCLPDQKLAYLQKLQSGGAIVAMVGDGVNDAAVLSAADVSFAMGGGAALAQMRADCVLLSGRLSALTILDDTAGKTLRVIRQNLIWATLYNVLAIPAAALGFLHPWMSGIGMSVSSAVVVVNALRLQRVPRGT